MSRIDDIQHLAELTKEDLVTKKADVLRDILDRELGLGQIESISNAGLVHLIHHIASIHIDRLRREQNISPRGNSSHSATESKSKATSSSRSPTPARSPRIPSRIASEMNVRETAELVSVMYEQNHRLRTRVASLRKALRPTKKSVLDLDTALRMQVTRRKRIAAFTLHRQKIVPYPSFQELWGTKVNGYLLFRDDDLFQQLEITSSDEEGGEKIKASINLNAVKVVDDSESDGEYSPDRNVRAQSPPLPSPISPYQYK
ncbi:hypothetical protein FA15DRAFT_693692 [Coprinopsis marcescibilis]|uniref:Uncharacterized protein n=1 Tax=Coprinopsis marcescibilis TaxID=230819 RepID=A0A5C3KYC5_COPMA|nr:hypothetical protein FA15DRAFT_693692 [Coprinopsis marcescibilis]